MKTEAPKEQPNTARWQLLRDLGVLQVKLLVDGLRDLILVPASLVAGIFGAVSNSPEEIERPSGFGAQDIDDIVGRLETFVVDEVKRGGVTTQTKERLDKILNAMQRNKDGGKSGD